MSGVLIRWGDWDTDMHEERPCEDMKKTAIYKPRRKALEEMNPTDTLVSDF